MQTEMYFVLGNMQYLAPDAVNRGVLLALLRQLLQYVWGAEDGLQVHPGTLQGQPLINHLAD